MTDSPTPQSLWATTLEQLRGQMLRSTFETWLQNTVVLSTTDEYYLIGVHSPAAQAWLENRLKETIEHTLENVLAQKVRVSFQVRSPASNPETIDPSALPSVEPAVSDVGQSYAQSTDFHRLWQRSGYGQVPHYVANFWLPYLKSGPFALWKYLDSTDQTDLKQIANRWTTPDTYRYRKLAGQLGSKSRRCVTGGLLECSHSRTQRLLGQPLPNCCGQRDIHQFKPDRVGQNRCHYWKAGALEILYEEKLLALEIDAQSSSPSGHKLSLQVWRIFPVLSPLQVETLPPALQDIHRFWLKSHEKLLALSHQEWEEITAPTLVSYMAGYDSYRTLFGSYQFNRILAETEQVRGATE